VALQRASDKRDYTVFSEKKQAAQNNGRMFAVSGHPLITDIFYPQITQIGADY
jgi:hypothetical protein